MFLKQMKTRSGRVRLAIYESYWQDGKSKQRVVKPLGFLDELEEIYDNPVTWGKTLAKKMTEEKRSSTQDVSVVIHPAQKIDKRKSNVKNIGSAVIYAIYSGLGIGDALRSALRSSEAKYNTDAIVRLLVCERMISPGSKLSAWQRRDQYFFRTDFSDDDIYRALDGIAEAKHTVISAMNRSIAKAHLRDMSAVYYDVTNYYFEIDDEDELRRRGKSKQHRPNPLVQMGLLQDANAIPISYNIFPGNTADCTTLIPTLADLKRDFNLERVVAVADKGLNSSENIVAALTSGDGFVFSQSIRGTKSDKELRAWVVDDNGYLIKDDFKIKSKQGYKSIHLRATQTATGKAQDIKIEVKYVAFWSGNYARRAQHERSKVVEKARALIKNPGAYSRATGYGAARYVKGLHFDDKTGEIVNGRTLYLDEKAIEKESALDGYYLIVTSETSWSDEKIIDTYRELWRIEETFKITKSEIATRPVYVWKTKHIEAHFLTCYMTLVILRLLQYASGLSCSCIRRELSAMNCINIDASWWVCGHRSDDSDILVDSVGLEKLKLKNLRTIDIRKILASAARSKIPQEK